MIVRADDLRPEGLQVDRPLQIGPLSDEGGQEIGVSDSGLKARIQPSNGGLTCVGRVTATVQMPCSRCLKPYGLPVDREFDVVYRPGPPVPVPKERELKISHEDLNVAYLGAERVFDLAALAAEQIYLELPMKPLCKADCRGLCTGCGVNLNIEGCRCTLADPAAQK